ncbi:hypothetical protein PHYSODRAFT_307679 [Phytophthora sojae]|uniref:Uncharacterized protein n=1 Tax=Phytophthora sojae (strain P6497) TaxID=1094619 RepID=G5AGD8_PHYSP|nr:hypothetical protein PHYSODRAFT_307679 [Phytophthora sojae]EGZ05378.1 hypothetical protein PHYSODRAFT_307679 [Phytophthora sojae]|eukprot:XP_009538909.1 hypothetical protein PHYSODRAFT_307679 [Phytophthora sojae]
MTELSFSAMWRNLRARGWRHQPPRGLSTVTKYYTPNGWADKANAERRVDVFWGEDELLRIVPEQVYGRAGTTNKATKVGRWSADCASNTASNAVHPFPSSPGLTAKHPSKSALQHWYCISSFGYTRVDIVVYGYASFDTVPNHYTNFNAVFGSGDIGPTGAHYHDTSTAFTGATKRSPLSASATATAGPATIKPSSSAAEDGIFLGSGDEEDYSVDDEVSDDDSIFLPDANDGESCDESDDGTIPDTVSEEPSEDDPDLLRLLYASASAEDLSKADLRLHTLKGWMSTWTARASVICHDIQLPAAQLSRDQAAPSDTAEAIGLNLEAELLLISLQSGVSADELATRPSDP